MEIPAVGAHSGSLPNTNPQPAPAFSTLQRGGNASVRGAHSGSVSDSSARHTPALKLVLALHNITADSTMLLTPRALSRKS